MLGDQPEVQVLQLYTSGCRVTFTIKQDMTDQVQNIVISCFIPFRGMLSSISCKIKLEK
jgi:hypothetical protein